MPLGKLRKKNKRAVSPVIAIVLMIVLGIAAASTVALILSNSNGSPPTVDTSGTNTLGTSTDGSEPDITVSIAGLTGDINLILQNISDFTEITLDIVYNGPDAVIYIVDIDILIYGEKLDDISPWIIDSVQGATYTTFEGRFAGYAQTMGSTATYQVVLSDINSTAARIPSGVSFSYQLKYSTVLGTVSDVEERFKEAEIIFNPVFYNISILNWNSAWNADSAAGQIESSLVLLNGTNNVFFRYNRLNDAYDYSNPAVVSAMNTTWMAEYYDVVAVDKWVVPNVNNIGQKIYEIHTNGTGLMFYGSIEEFDPNNENTAVMNTFIDYPLTANITGLVPIPWMGATPAGTLNGYSFAGKFDEMLAGIAGDVFWEVPWLSFIERGDRVGADIANLVLNSEGFDILGNSTYQFYNTFWNPGPSNLIWENQGISLIRKNKVINGTGTAYSYVWKTHEEINDRLATKTDGAHLAQIRKNMLLSLIGEVERTSLAVAELTIDYVRFQVRDAGNTRFDIEIQATVSAGDIKGGTLVVDVQAPSPFNWFWTTFLTRYNVYIDGNLVIDGAWMLPDTANDLFTFNVGAEYGADIIKDSVIVFTVNRASGDGNWLRLNNADTTYYDWFVDANFESGIFSLPRSATFTINTSIDFAVWP